MTELLTAAQMGAIEQTAIDSGEVTGLELIERAGQGVVEAIFEEWPEFKNAPQSVCVLCGPGNNGGDGFVVARLLKALGWCVRVLLFGEIEKLPDDARTNAALWTAENQIEPLTEANLRRLPDTLVIDALFGTGLSRALTGESEKVIAHLAGRNGDDYSQNLICIDGPSGLCLDSGQAIAGPFAGLNRCETSFAKLTVTFDSPKIGHFIQNGPLWCGRIIVKDIGLHNWRCFKPMTTTLPTGKQRNRKFGSYRLPMLHLLTRTPLIPDQRLRFVPFHHALTMVIKRSEGTSDQHKFSHGHAVIASGPAIKTGAARLAARAALRIGAGLVTVASPTEALLENASQLTAIMLRKADTSEDFTNLLSDDRISSVCLGPGFARESEFGGLDFYHTREMVEIALIAQKKTVLDADVLTAFADNPDQLFENLHPDCVLTPHAGEFARLFPDIAAKLNASAITGPAYSKVDATRAAAARAGCTILFKGADTVIANEQGWAAINSAHYDRAAPWLATAGSGDVLAGFITGLMARGFTSMQAAESAAWLHVECALKFGPGLIAEDIPEQLPAVFRDLNL